MGNIYLFFVIILFILAIADLVVGVSNDAVNFLNSAVGSKAASMKVILIVASLGVLLGATFSSGMMEVARKGIFHPEMFTFAEIMVLFLAVMITDIILLDFFNTIGLPTSTTVSIVFELLGSAVAVSMLIIYGGKNIPSQNIADYINTGKALAIIGGILFSVVVAFIVGTVVQYLSRLVFSFQYHKYLKYFGGLFGGIAISAITYFIFIKGLKGASFISPNIVQYVQSHTYYIVTVSFIICSLFLQILYWIFKINIPRLIVIVGTFALAMAFAGNDLVNFIGVPLAGLSSYTAYVHSGLGASQLYMRVLTEPVSSGTYILFGAGIVMIATLWTSAKARSVIATTVDLSRQDEGAERFSSSNFSRFIVRVSVAFSEGMTKVMPNKMLVAVDNRFKTPVVDEDDSDRPAFDLIRASVNLSVASILIALATSLKLPLSTTYVTFMVAMGTSLADRAWGRDSAVYRITGVFTVISGWFMTAFIAFSAAFIVACLLFYTQIYGAILMTAIAGFSMYKSYKSYKINKFEKLKKTVVEKGEFIDESGTYLERSNNAVNVALLRSSKIYCKILQGLIDEDRRELKAIKNEVIDFSRHVKDLKDNLYKFLRKLNKLSIESGHFYVQVLDYMREMAHSLQFMAEPAFEHVANKHKSLNKEQKEELAELITSVSLLFNETLVLTKQMKYDESSTIISSIEESLNIILRFRKNQIHRIKKGKVKTRNSMLYLGILQESKGLLLFLINLIKAQRDFVIYSEKANG